MEVAFSKGKPIDDKQMTMEKMIAVIANLPESSKLRTKMTAKVIDGLWASLQHPPLSYLGDKFRYRQADGSYNNPLNPELGQAGSPYARSVATKKRQHVVRPDPALLFDMLMAREDGEFKENPAGISSMLFYHATIIIHDIFRTNRTDPTISDTSSYLGKCCPITIHAASRKTGSFVSELRWAPVDFTTHHLVLSKYKYTSYSILPRRC